MKVELNNEQKSILKRIESEASYKQSDYFREKGFGNFEIIAENEERPRNIIFINPSFPKEFEEVTTQSDKIYREHLILEMKKAGFDNAQILEYIKYKTGRISFVEECKRLLEM